MFRKPNPFSIQSSKSTLTDDVLWSQRNKCFRKLRRLWVIYIPGKTVSISNLFSRLFFSFPLLTLTSTSPGSHPRLLRKGILLKIRGESGGYFLKTLLHKMHRNSVVSTLHTFPSSGSDWWLLKLLKYLCWHKALRFSTCILKQKTVYFYPTERNK